ncbi:MULTISPECIES: replication initiator protein A [unclassified Meiothermus]|uniref:replication initiator protein A n=1 Tax=unclassified Meiothermus TaxID=370471 RepID=UPI000D7D1F8C|nr:MULTISPECIES: replication initiator protein A [unclassified Meiothermus]PZA08058.1 cupin [Meiothermus sp. Pnk-1]RYM36491.1 cupin [Meiothermus sp. PNK-Is4]
MAQKSPNDNNEIQRFDEANVARLGLISIQERIPSDFTSWTIDFAVDGRQARLSCVAVAEHGGVPHGLDNDVSLALITLYQEAGSPEDGTIVTTAYRILSVIGWDTSGHYYQALKESLDRLTTATFTASEAWRSGKKWTTVKFRYIDRLEYTSEDDKLGLSGQSVLKIKLAREIVESIRAKYLKPLDLEFLTSLDRPLTRALYRLLDAQRITPEGGEVTQFRTNIVEWAKACKIVDQTPSRVRRTLEGAHAELVERGYLAAVEYQGRGPKQEVIYTFAKQAALPEGAREVVARLSRYGVARPVAHSLIGVYGLERVEERIARFEAILLAGYTPRNRAGFLVDVVRDEEGKYSDPEGFVSKSRRMEADAAKAKRAEAAKRAEERKNQQAEAEWESLDAKGRAAKAMRILSLILGKHVPIRYFSGLMEAFESGRLDPREVAEGAVRAQVQLQLVPFTQELMRVLDSLEAE